MLWKIYENVIYRFCYGEYLSHRDKILEYAKPSALFFQERLPVVKDRLKLCSLNEMLYALKPKDISYDMLKNYGISFWHMLADEDYNLFDDFNKYNKGCTVELRVPNGTLDEIIWQNNINFFIHLILYCKSDNFDYDILNKRNILIDGINSSLQTYSRIYLDQALELCDLIFDKNIDKIYFLRQYLKSFEVTGKCFVKAKKFTMKEFQ